MNIKKIYRMMALTACCGVISASHAALPTDEGKKSVESILAKLGEKIDKIDYFDGPGNFVGVIVQGGGDPPVVIWTTPDGKYLFAGNLLDKNGRNLTDLAAQFYKAENPINVTMNQVVQTTVKELLPKSIQVETLERMQKNLTKVEQNKDKSNKSLEHAKVPEDLLFQSIDKIIESGNVIVAGKQNEKNGRIVIFHDPMCEFCKEFFNEMKKRSLWNYYAVYWIPVVSVGKPEVSLKLVEDPRFDYLMALESNPRAEPSQRRVPEDKAKEIVALHTEMLGAMITDAATPTVILQNAKGEKKIVIGSNIKEVMDFMGRGVPPAPVKKVEPKKNTDESNN